MGAPARFCPQERGSGSATGSAVPPQPRAPRRPCSSRAGAGGIFGKRSAPLLLAANVCGQQGLKGLCTGLRLRELEGTPDNATVPFQRAAPWYDPGFLSDSHRDGGTAEPRLQEEGIPVPQHLQGRAVICGRRAADTHGAGRKATKRHKSDFLGPSEGRCCFPMDLFLSGSQISEVQGQFPCPAALSQLAAVGSGPPGRGAPAERFPSALPAPVPGSLFPGARCGAGGGRGPRRAPNLGSTPRVVCVVSPPGHTAAPIPADRGTPVLFCP